MWLEPVVSHAVRCYRGLEALELVENSPEEWCVRTTAGGSELPHLLYLCTLWSYVAKALPLFYVGGYPMT